MDEPDWSTRQIAAGKIANYLMNDAHPSGQHKARFFRALGFSHAGLETALLEHPIRHPTFDIALTPFGRKMIIRCGVRCPDGSERCMVTVWIEARDGGIRLVTAYRAT